jgi:AraC family transcriptional regulator of adaptative response / methylphosphotriester-DNA alkyltransferase methyltransferase
MNVQTNKRPQKIKDAYISLIDEHLRNLINCRIDRMFEIEDFAERMHIHPVHLSNTIKELTGTSACGLYQPKILEAAKQLLAEGAKVRATALLLTFEPSHFTKWFKTLCGQTPRQFIKSLNQDHFY